MGDHEPGLVSLPRVADRRCTENAHAQQRIEQREPPGVPDAEFHGLGAIPAFDERAEPQHDRQEGDQNDREPQRCQKLVDAENEPHGGRLIGRHEPAGCHRNLSRAAGRERTLVPGSIAPPSSRRRVGVPFPGARDAANGYRQPNASAIALSNGFASVVLSGLPIVRTRS